MPGTYEAGMRDMYGSLPPQPGVLVSFARAPRGLLTEAVSRLARAALATDGRRSRPVRARSGRVPPPAVAADYL